MKLAERLAVLEDVVIPLWVFDLEELEFVWGNKAGIDLWGARDLADFLKRDLKSPPAAMRTVLRTQLETVRAGRTNIEQVTFYPHGVPKTVRFHMSGVALEDGRLAALCQVLDAEAGASAEVLRGFEAIRHLGAMVSMVDISGRVLMQNPAGVRAFGAEGALDEWFADEGVKGAIEREVSAERVFRGELLARTLLGERWHAVEAHGKLDPVTGERAVLLLQMDVTEMHESRQLIARQEEEIRNLSTPILDVGEGALALPLFGVLSEARSQEIAGRLLPEVTARRAGSVILDLTGLLSLDEAGAEALMKVVRAVELLGARPIVTGIQPRMAAMLAGGGAGARSGLGGILTLRSLSEGLEVSRARASTGPGAPRS